MPEAAPVTSAISPWKAGGSAAGAQFRLLQLPILHIEDIAGRQGAPAAKLLGTLDDLHGVVVDVGDNASFLGTLADAQHAELRIEHHPRCRIKYLHRTARLG